MADGSRVPRSIEGFDNWINMAVNYLLAILPGTASESWVRLGILGAEINQLIAYRDQWNGWHVKYVNKNEVRTKAIKDAMLMVRDNTLPLGETILNRIEGSATAMLDDLETFKLKNHPLLRDDSPTLEPVPTSHPIVLSIDCSEPGLHIIRFKDEFAEGRGKPKGIKFAEVAMMVRPFDSPPDSVDDCQIYQIASRSPHRVNFNPADSGKMAFYFLRWINTNGKVGGWSAMYHAPIA